MIKILTLSCMFLFATQVIAQDGSITPVCKVYGAVQGVSYDSFKKMCTTASSSEACQELLDELSASFNMATLSKEDYVKANVMGCKIVLRNLKNGISFSIEGAKKSKDTLQELYQILIDNKIRAYKKL